MAQQGVETSLLVVYIPTCCYIREPAAFHRGVASEDDGGTSVGREASNNCPREKGRTFLSFFFCLAAKTRTCFLCRIEPDDLNIQEQHEILQCCLLEQPEARRACRVMSDHDDER